MQRLLSAMVDHYLDLRQPLAERLDNLQRQLLDPHKPFHDWAKLLDSRRQSASCRTSPRSSATRSRNGATTGSPTCRRR